MIPLDKIGLSYAFNRGCQARLDGLECCQNPYVKGCPYFLQWEFGWEDVDTFWGTLVQGRWRFDPLPEVAKPCP